MWNAIDQELADTIEAARIKRTRAIRYRALRDRLRSAVGDTAGDLSVNDVVESVAAEVERVRRVDIRP